VFLTSFSVTLTFAPLPLAASAIFFIITDWRRTARSIVLQKIFVCFFYIEKKKKLKFIFEPHQLFFQIRVKNS